MRQVAFRLELVHVDEGAAHGAPPDQASRTGERLRASLARAGLAHLPLHCVPLERVFDGDAELASSGPVLEDACAGGAAHRPQLVELLAVSMQDWSTCLTWHTSLLAGPGRVRRVSLVGPRSLRGWLRSPARKEADTGRKEYRQQEAWCCSALLLRGRKGVLTLTTCQPWSTQPVRAVEDVTRREDLLRRS